MSDLVQIEAAEGIATLWLNRPASRNAVSLAMWDALAAAFGEVNKDSALRCLILRGRPSEDGRVAFSAGADISEFPEKRASAEQARAYAGHMEPAVAALAESPHPSIAMIQGSCTGGGLELALHCDLRFAGEGARLGMPIQRIGHGLPLTAMRALVQLVGRATALELLLDARLLDAQEAYVKGLVNRVFPTEKVIEETLASARRIAKGAPLAHRFHREATRRALQPKAYSQKELNEPHKLCDTADYAEGVRAFLAKEEPQFRGE
ncbi:MAG: enoyl-CoA hydratase-related protein [Rhodospirillales bacterium]